MSGFIDTQQAAKILHVTPKTLRKLCSRAEISHYKSGGKTTSYKFKETDLYAYMERYRVEAKGISRTN
ncbi:MAG: helix-turn-helix domain-containing protein [Bacteroidales bacterium]|jgi:excisionase family DNA binding protein|nr:helix-turn-helix domain-containing protein [Bacteroidales bacterium]